MQYVKEIFHDCTDRFELWQEFIHFKQFKTIAEIGVYKGEFSENILRKCHSIKKYYMIDPWRRISDWNKPANTSDNNFKLYFKEALEKTSFAKDKRVIMRGKTTEVIQQIKNEELDLVYIDGDHTLKGITIDLICSWKKIKPTGFLAGDDFCSSIWQHDKKFEPTLIFPFAVYFAEAMNTKIYALPFNQFLITKELNGFEFIDLTNNDYKHIELLPQLKSF